jgi:hypothetical protein
MRNSISKSIIADGAGDVDGRQYSSDPGVPETAWRWLSPGLSTSLLPRLCRFSPKLQYAKPRSWGA